MNTYITRISLIILIWLTISSQVLANDIRNLRLFVTYNNNVSLTKTLHLIREASDLTEKEICIRFEVVRAISLGTDSIYGNISLRPDLALAQLKSLGWYEGNKGNGFDIALAFANDPPMTKNLGWFLSKPFGVIEDRWRRYIIFYHPTVRVIRHEIYHGFLFNEGHTTKLMAGGIGTFMPFNQWLSDEDKIEVLKNKWRDFRYVPTIPKEFQQDFPRN